MASYRNLKNVVLSTQAATHEFTYLFDVPFPVDQIIVRMYSYTDKSTVDTNVHMCVLRSDLVSGNIVATMLDNAGTHVFMHSQFPGIHQSMQGSYTFRFTQLDGSQVSHPDDFAYDVTMNFEFIQF